MKKGNYESNDEYTCDYVLIVESVRASRRREYGQPSRRPVMKPCHGVSELSIIIIKLPCVSCNFGLGEGGGGHVAQWSAGLVPRSAKPPHIPRVPNAQLGCELQYWGNGSASSRFDRETATDKLSIFGFWLDGHGQDKTSFSAGLDR